MRLMPFGLPITRAYAAYLCRDRHHASLRPGVAVTRERPCLCSLTAHSPGPRILVAVRPPLARPIEGEAANDLAGEQWPSRAPGRESPPRAICRCGKSRGGRRCAGRRALVIYVVRKEKPWDRSAFLPR